MKRILLCLALAFATAAQGAAPDPGTPQLPELKPEQQQARAAHLAAELLTRYHYKATQLDDAMSGKIFDHYLKSLDPEKLYFAQTDIDSLAGNRGALGDAIAGEDLTVPFSIYNLYLRRLSERYAYARSLLKAGFDFRQNENMRYERDQEPWPQSAAELHELWRMEAKNDWLRLKLAGNDDREIAGILDRRYGNAQRRIAQITSQDAFQAFMNAYTTAIEPHTNYMRPRTAEDFDTSMKLSLVGVGASLEDKNGYCTIRELVPGGPAALSGKVNIGDRILGVAHGEDGAMTDIQGWRMDDAVAQIHGAAGSLVRLDILPVGVGPDGKHRLAALVLKKFGLEDQAAKMSVLSIKDRETTRRIGVISLPGFYEDFEARRTGDPEFKSATRDVARLLGELKKEKVDSVLVDLRGNGGGSMEEAVELTGLFIGKGPVVQERDAGGKVDTLESNAEAGAVWTGPLGVLIDRSSASASEVFAAAIQDYGRGLLFGAPSFGKGTVQTLIDLDHVAKNEKPEFGELKMTIGQFFRINGGTTQLRGVEPDIRFPEVLDMNRFGESSFDNALPYSQIAAAKYSPAGDLKFLVPELQERHDARVKNDMDYQNLQEDIAELKRERQKNLLSLNESARRSERDTREARAADRERRSEAAQGIQTVSSGQKTAAANGKPARDDGLQTDERPLASELAAENAGKNAKDVLLGEAAQILSDEVRLLRARARFVAEINTLSVNTPDPENGADAHRAGVR